MTVRIAWGGCAAVIALLLPTPGACWDGLAPYAEESRILATTPSTDDGAIGAMFNPAQWGVLERPELSFFWSDVDARPNKMDDWGLSMGGGLGVSVRRRDERTPVGTRDVTDWQIGIGGGSDAHYGGFAFGFSGAGKGAFGRENFLSLGEIWRPNRWLSYGNAARFALSGGDMEGVIDLGIRPLGDPRIQLFADYALGRGDRWDDGPLAGGVSVRPLTGLRAAARWAHDDRIQVTVGVTLQRTGFRATPEYDRDGNLGATRYAVRLNPPERGVDWDRWRSRGRRFVHMDLKGRAVYRVYRFGDKGSLALRSILDRFQTAADDPTVGGVSLNLSGFAANPSMIWEIRQKLLALKARGKKVVLYADRLDASGFYLASVADRFVMDPRGALLLPGVQISRTYLKGTLDKLGIGFDEWRYFKYKSALETFSRTGMSEADREQFQALADAAYAELADGVAATGRATRAGFDEVVNREPFLSAKRLLDLRWVDALGRPEDLKEGVRVVGGRRARLVSARRLDAIRWQPEEEWGPRPAIALVYAVGPCAMDDGIRARETSKQLRKFREDHDVKAVVVRADSPGGDPLASDLVAHELRAMHRAKKPVLVSQGRVAASGGYWISMDADTITATPFTVTGAIGVIGGWAWNDGFGKKTGLTSDHVQVGKSADLMGGIRLPLLGATLPERNLDGEERRVVEGAFTELYDDFTNKVSSARRLDLARVREIAEGRVYLGRDAHELKLVDRIAGLDETIEAARRLAGISPKRKVRIIEYPKPGFLRLPRLFSGLGSSRGGAIEPLSELSYEARVLQEILNRPGEPLLLAPGTLLPTEVEPRP